MSLLTAPPPAAATSALPPTTLRESGTRTTLRQRLFKPGWPLAWLFVGYPLWWILGISEAMTFVLAGVMALELFRRRTVIAPRGFGLYLLFLAWCLAGVFLLQVDAAGAVPGSSDGRYLVWAFRMMWYVSAMVMMLYVGNLRRVLSLERVARILSWMFVTIVVGGFLGALFPLLDFPSAIELVLPKSLVDIPFVQQMVHPNLAQVQRVLGFQEARPSAPFAYTNTWGLAFVCFLPFFVLSWLRKGAGWRRVVGPVVLLLAVVPVIQSLNRGLWGALIGVAVFAAFRYALMGRTKVFFIMLLSFVALTGVVVTTPLAETIALRWDNQHSNEGRTDLGTLTVTSTLERSPVLGYGTTRDVQGNFNSIAGGSTPECPKCSPPSLGTQGQAWLLTFTTGIGGLLLYAGFFLIQFVRSIRIRSANATAGLCVLVAHAITSVVYNVNGPGLLAIMIAVAFLWRESMLTDNTASWQRRWSAKLPTPTIGGYVNLVRRNLLLLLVLGTVGGVLGLVALEARGVATKSRVSVTVAEQPPLSRDAPSLSLDSEAAFVTTEPVLTAVSRKVGLPVTEEDLSVSATPNSRVLHITYVAPSQEQAQAGATAAAEAFLATRVARLTAERAGIVASLDEQVEVARRTLLRSQAILGQLRLTPSAPNSETIRLLNNDIDRQVSDLGRLLVRQERANNQSVQAGTVISSATARPDWGLVRIVAVSGVMLGLLLGLLIALLRDRITPRVRSTRVLARYTDIPVVAELSMHDGYAIPGVRPLAQSLVSRGARACLSAGRTRDARSLARALDASISFEVDARSRDSSARPVSRPGVVIVVDRSCRARDVNNIRDITERAGNVVLGVVYLRNTARRSTRKSRNVRQQGRQPLTLSGVTERG